MKDFVLITGASKGLGKSLSFTFAKGGYNLIIHGRDEKKINELQTYLKNYGIITKSVIGDLRDFKTLNSLIQVSKKENLEILINNAGISLNSPIEDLSYQKIREVIEVNLIAPVYLMKEIYPFFKNKKNGMIININSLISFKSKKDFELYAASKSGLKGFTDSLKFRSKQDGINILDVCPGGMQTDSYLGDKKDKPKCINPMEISKIIFNIAKQYKTCSIEEIIINRKNY